MCRQSLCQHCCFTVFCSFCVCCYLIVSCIWQNQWNRRRIFILNVNGSAVTVSIGSFHDHSISVYCCRICLPAYIYDLSCRNICLIHRQWRLLRNYIAPCFYPIIRWIKKSLFRLDIKFIVILCSRCQSHAKVRICSLPDIAWSGTWTHTICTLSLIPVIDLILVCI